MKKSKENIEKTKQNDPNKKKSQSPYEKLKEINAKCWENQTKQSKWKRKRETHVRKMKKSMKNVEKTEQNNQSIYWESHTCTEIASGDRSYGILRRTPANPHLSLLFCFHFESTQRPEMGIAFSSNPNLRQEKPGKKKKCPWWVLQENILKVLQPLPWSNNRPSSPS